MPDLVFDNISIVYSRRSRTGTTPVKAVSNVSLTLPAGGTLGIAGESGSGKSTLAMSVLRLLPKSATITGRILYGDQDIQDLSFGQLRTVRWAEAAVVFQGAMHALNPVRTVGWQILEALELHVKERWATREARVARMKDLLAMVDLPTDKSEAYPHELSGGQKQRVMVAMALACEPDVIIADEPTTALDVIVQEQVLNVLHSLVTERGISLLMISHDLSALATICDRIAVMKDGVVREVGDAVSICTAATDPYTRKLAQAFPVIGDPASRLKPQSKPIWEVAADGGTDGLEQTNSDPHEVVLEARGVSVNFRSHGRTVHAVRSVDLTCHRAEITALVGQSGSGKTTLARTILGLQEPNAGGQVLFRGEPLKLTKRGLREYRRNVQLVFQDQFAALNPKVSVYESISEGLRIRKYDGDEYAKVCESLEACEMSPASEYLDVLPQELSGGQRQRVVIAGALAIEPSALIADEPVASLDASVRGELLGLFLALKRRMGMTALVITHDLGLAWNIADTVAVMYNGEIVERGTVEKVLLDPQHEYTKKLLHATPKIPTLA